MNAPDDGTFPVSRIRSTWIDVLRGIAILAVVLDHADLLRPGYMHPLAVKYTFLSITWFIFLVGVTSVLSASARPWLGLQGYISYWRRRLPAVAVYLASSSVVYILSPHYEKSAAGLIGRIFTFSVSPPYYFFFILFQMYLIFPFMYHLFVRFPRGIVAVCGMVACVVAALVVRVTGGYWYWTIPNTVLGGPYLPVFWLGIVYALYAEKLRLAEPVVAWVLFLVTTYVFIDTDGRLVSIEPGIRMFVWAIPVFFVVKHLYSLTKRFITPVWGLFAFLGRQSLVIFLFHYVLIQLLLPVPLNGPAAFYLMVLLVILLPVEFFAGIRTMLRWLSAGRVILPVRTTGRIE